MKILESIINFIKYLYKIIKEINIWKSFNKKSNDERIKIKEKYDKKIKEDSQKVINGDVTKVNEIFN